MRNIQTLLLNSVLQRLVSAGLHSCLQCWFGFLGFSQPFGWFGVLDVLWLQHSWDCFPLVAACWGSSCGLLGMCWSSCLESPKMWVRSRPSIWPSPGGRKYTIGSLLFSRLHFPGFWWGKHDLLGAPQGDTNQFIVFSMWLGHLWMCDLFSRKSIHRQQTQYIFFSCFHFFSNPIGIENTCFCFNQVAKMTDLITEKTAAAQ